MRFHFDRLSPSSLISLKLSLDRPRISGPPLSQVSLLTENGNTKDDLRLPTDDALLTQSCLAFRYEALVLRQLRSTSNQWLQVSYREWMTFAEYSLNNGFYFIARMACESALACFEINGMVDPQTDDFFKNVEVIGKIKRLKDVAVVSSASRSEGENKWVITILNDDKDAVRVYRQEKELQAKEAELRRREQDVYMYFRGSGKAAEMKREAAKRTMMAALP